MDSVPSGEFSSDIARIGAAGHRGGDFGRICIFGGRGQCISPRHPQRATARTHRVQEEILRQLQGALKQNRVDTRS